MGGSWNPSLQENQILILFHVQNSDILKGDLCIPEVSRHPMALNTRQDRYGR